jgi:hypothetical protein
MKHKKKRYKIQYIYIPNEIEKPNQLQQYSHFITDRYTNHKMFRKAV